MELIFKRVENILRKRENAGFQHFLVFSKMFSKEFFPLDCKTEIEIELLKLGMV